MANDLEQKIVTQLEYYFGDINLPRDKFLKDAIEKNEGGWVPLDVLLTFKRLSDLSKDKSIIVDAIGKATSKLLEVSEDKEKLRRSADNPLPNLTSEEWNAALLPRSVYVKGFPTDETFDNIMQFMRTHGQIDSVSMRHYKDKATNSNKFKGSICAIFNNEEDCKKFLAAESTKYNDHVLQKMSQEAFIAEKKAEFQEKKEKRNKKSKENKVEKVIEYPKKTIVKLTGSSIAERLEWNDIKGKVKEITEIEPAHIDFKSGQTEGQMRFREENAGETFIGKLTDGKLTVGDFEFTAKLASDEEELEYYREWEQERLNRKNKSKHFGKKRKGNFNRDSPRAKKQAQD